MEPGRDREAVRSHLASARQLNRIVSEVFSSWSAFRIDHYPGKETTQNLMACGSRTKKTASRPQDQALPTSPPTSSARQCRQRVRMPDQARAERYKGLLSHRTPSRSSATMAATKSGVAAAAISDVPIASG